MPVKREMQSSFLLTGIPDDVLIQFNLLIMSGVRIETGRDMK